MSIFDRFKRKKAPKKVGFEDEFMDLQTQLISLCLEVVEGKADKVYAYASIEEKSQSFNAFFEIDGEVKSISDLDISEDLMDQCLLLGIDDLMKIRELCERHNRERPTEIRMHYNVKNGEFDADYEYEEVCSAKTGLTAHQVFYDWFDKVKAGGAK